MDATMPPQDAGAGSDVTTHTDGSWDAAADTTVPDSGMPDEGAGEAGAPEGGPGDAGTGDGGDAGPACPPGLTCNVSCSDGGTTEISGAVYDPAGQNPLFNVAVYVPARPLAPLPKGVPVGPDACNCGALFPSGAIASTTTALDGTFTLANVPVGDAVPLVLQIGKWRHLLHVKVAQCMPNPQPARLLLPGSVPAGNTDENMPDIAVSTGSADTLECLFQRMGLPASEYVAGAGGTGHVHVFSGGQTGGMPTGMGPGQAENPGMAGAPASSTSLWSSVDQLMPYDVTVLSCEGGETYNANPQALEEYLNRGGRAFASHFHYAFFSGPISSTQSYTAPADWGTNLATWTNPGTNTAGPIGGSIVQVLNGTTNTPFPKGVVLANWLQLVGALGKNGVPANDLSIYDPRYNAVVSSSNKPSQAWITSDTAMAGETMHFSFDTPVNAPTAPDGGPPGYCGRAMFSDLHVGSNAGDGTAPPGACRGGPLSPQEKALEFMVFDLLGCVIPDSTRP
jgi:hypothetical protein